MFVSPPVVSVSPVLFLRHSVIKLSFYFAPWISKPFYYGMTLLFKIALQISVGKLSLIASLAYFVFLGSICSDSKIPLASRIFVSVHSWVNAGSCMCVRTSAAYIPGKFCSYSCTFLYLSSMGVFASV